METVNHPVLGRLNATVTPVRSDGDGQVSDTIALMRGYVLADKASPQVKQAVRAALGRNPDPVNAVFDYVKGMVSFVNDSDISQSWNDPDIVEVLIRPVDMLSLGSVAQGDCDDFVMLGSAMLMNLDIDVQFVTVAADPRDPSRFSHIYLAAYVDGQRIPMDMSHGPHPGWEVPAHMVYAKREWAVKRNPLAMVLTLGAIYYAVQRYS